LSTIYMMNVINVGKSSFVTVKSTKHVKVAYSKQPRYLTPSGQVCHGGNLKEVKNRIKSVVSIKKITKTMNMIATARLKQAQNRMERARIFYNTVKPMEAFAPAADKDVKKQVVIPVSSDKGLCGAINSNITKHIRALLRDKSTGMETTLNCIGEKAPGQLGREYGNLITWSAGDTSKKPLNFLASSLLAERILSTEFDRASLVYNKFNNIISYTTTTLELSSPTSFVNRKDAFDEYEFEDDEHLHHIPDAAEYFLAGAILRAFADGNAAELGGRMSSMDNATRNAGEMIKKLTIMYNRKRQAAITTELTEIISGAAAVQQ